MCGLAAVEHHGAPVGLDDAAYRLEQCGLAGAVRAQQRDTCAFLDCEVDVEQHLHRAVEDVEAAHEQQRRPSLTPLVGNLGTSRGCPPHVRDVVGDHMRCGGDHEPADHKR